MTLRDLSIRARSAVQWACRDVPLCAGCLAWIACLAGHALAADPPDQAPRAEASSDSSVAFDTSAELGGYSDSDSVSILTPSVNAGVGDSLAGWRIGGGYLVDIVSAASVDIVATATPRWQELRHVGSLDARVQPGVFGVGVSGGVSYEPDYLSWAVNGRMMLDLADKTVNPRLGYGYARDVAGRTGTPLSEYGLTLERHLINAALELVLDKASILTIVGDAQIELGEQIKPYRYLPLFAPAVAPAVPNGASVDLVNQVRLQGRAAERLPLHRYRYAGSARYAHRFGWGTTRAFLRLYGDDWGMIAATSDAQQMFDAGERFVLWPRIRIHGQTGVAFWQRAYVAELGNAGLTLPELRSGDRELGPLVTATLGAGVRLNAGPVGDRNKWSIQLTGDAVLTHYFEALYVADRRAGYVALQLAGELD